MSEMLKSIWAVSKTMNHCRSAFVRVFLVTLGTFFGTILMLVLYGAGAPNDDRVIYSLVAYCIMVFYPLCVSGEKLYDRYVGSFLVSHGVDEYSFFHGTTLLIFLMIVFWVFPALSFIFYYTISRM